MPKNISAATLMVLSACIIWGAQPMFVTFVVREFDPIPLVSIRYFTVGVVLLAALAYSGEKLLPPRKAWLPLFLMGVLSVGGNNVAQFTGLIFWITLYCSQPYYYCLADACRDRTLKSGAAA